MLNCLRMLYVYTFAIVSLIFIPLYSAVDPRDHFGDHFQISVSSSYIFSVFLLTLIRGTDNAYDKRKVGESEGKDVDPMIIHTRTATLGT